jgi:hypothetical protein
VGLCFNHSNTPPIGKGVESNDNTGIRFIEHYFAHMIVGVSASQIVFHRSVLTIDKCRTCTYIYDLYVFTVFEAGHTSGHNHQKTLGHQTLLIPMPSVSSFIRQLMAFSQPSPPDLAAFNLSPGGAAHIS